MDDPAPVVTLEDDSGKESEPEEGEPGEKRRREAQQEAQSQKDMPLVEEVC